MGLRKKSPVSAARENLIKEIEDLKQALETANSNFENVCDPDLIDSYIYEMNAISVRYRYLLKQILKLQNPDYNLLPRQRSHSDCHVRMSALHKSAVYFP